MIKNSINQSIIGNNNIQTGAKSKGDIIVNNSDISSLRKKIKELEKQLEQKDNIINNLVEQQNKLITKLTNL